MLIDTPSEQLVESATRGDRAAFEALFKRYYARVYRTVYGMLGNESDAKEVAQEVWIKAWQKRSHYNFKAAYTTWLHRIAMNTALDAIRRRTRERKRFASISESETGQQVDQSIDPGKSPLKAAQSNEQRAQIVAAIQELPEEQRCVIVLKEFEHYTYAEIAGILDCKIGTVMSRLHLARKKLHSLFNHESP